MSTPRFYPDSGTSADRDEISAILDDELYLTNHRGAASAQMTTRFRITHVISVGAEFVGECPLAEIVYRHVEVHDAVHLRA